MVSPCLLARRKALILHNEDWINQAHSGWMNTQQHSLSQGDLLRILKAVLDTICRMIQASRVYLFNLLNEHSCTVNFGMATSCPIMHHPFMQMPPTVFERAYYWFPILSLHNQGAQKEWEWTSTCFVFPPLGIICLKYIILIFGSFVWNVKVCTDIKLKYIRLLAGSLTNMQKCLCIVPLHVIWHICLFY